MQREENDQSTSAAGLANNKLSAIIRPIISFIWVSSSSTSYYENCTVAYAHRMHPKNITQNWLSRLTRGTTFRHSSWQKQDQNYIYFRTISSSNRSTHGALKNCTIIIKKPKRKVWWKISFSIQPTNASNYMHVKELTSKKIMRINSAVMSSKRPAWLRHSKLCRHIGLYVTRDSDSINHYPVHTA